MGDGSSNAHFRMIYGVIGMSMLGVSVSCCATATYIYEKAFGRRGLVVIYCWMRDLATIPLSTDLSFV